MCLRNVHMEFASQFIETGTIKLGYVHRPGVAA
jgi:hypothetical protein